MTDSAKPTKIGWSYNKCPADGTYTIWLTDSDGECLPQGWVFDEKSAVGICRAMNRDHLFERMVKALKRDTDYLCDDCVSNHYDPEDEACQTCRLYNTCTLLKDINAAEGK